jgi:hypothetical protein
MRPSRSKVIVVGTGGTLSRTGAAACGRGDTPAMPTAVRSVPGALHRSTRPLDYRLGFRFPRARRAVMRWVLRMPPTARIRRILVPRAVLLAWSAYERGEIREPIEMAYAPDVELEVGAIQGAGPIGLPSTMSTREELIDFQVEWTESFAWMRYEVNELLDFGDAIVFGVRQEGEGRASGVIADVQMFTALRFRDGQVSWQLFSLERDEAIRAVGRDPDESPAAAGRL